MIVELQRFIEFPEDWWKLLPLEKFQTKDRLVMESMLINTRYVGYVRRSLVPVTFEMVEVGLVDWQRAFVFDKTYEEMKEILRRGEKHDHRAEGWR